MCIEQLRPIIFLEGKKVKTTYKIRLNDLAIEELSQTTDSVLDNKEDPFYEYSAWYHDNASKGCVVELSLKGVKALAKELAWQAYTSKANVEEGEDYYKPIYRACKTALANANKVLVSAGEDPVHP